MLQLPSSSHYHQFTMSTMAMTFTSSSNCSSRQQLPTVPHPISSCQEQNKLEEKSALMQSSLWRQRRRSIALAAAAVTAMLGAGEIRRPVPARAESWGTHSFIKEKYFQPDLSPEDAAARIRQTTEGLREMRHMLDTMSWKYVKFYVRLKSAYLDSDLKNAFSTVAEGRRSSYVRTANEVIDNMSELDRHVRSPKVYESYLYYEKTLKSLDELIALLA